MKGADRKKKELLPSKVPRLALSDNGKGIPTKSKKTV